MKIIITILILTITFSCSKSDKQKTPEPPFSFSENFDATVPELKTKGWIFLHNNSSDNNASLWHKGNEFEYNFDAHLGEPTSYISIDREAVFPPSPGDNLRIDSWLITPSLKLQNGDVITFWTRSLNVLRIDRLNVLLSVGNSTVHPTASSNGSFTKSILEINPNLQGSLYPVVWKKYSITVDGLSAATDCKIGFQYFFSPAGQQYSNCIGVDTFVITRP